MRDYFESLCETLNTAIQGQEIWLAGLEAENTRFCRFNHGKMRQQGTIDQTQLTLTLANGQKHSSHQLMLKKNHADDKKRLKAAIKDLRNRLKSVPDDPLFLLNEQIQHTEQLASHEPIDVMAISQAVTGSCLKDDFVGILLGGEQWSGFANSLGQRNWFEAKDYTLDYSLYLHTDKAVKDRLAGTQWQQESFLARLEQQRTHLALLAAPPLTLKPDHYRAYLTPTALKEIINLMSFSACGVQDKSSPLRRLHDKELNLHPMINITMDLQSGYAPRFQEEGFVMPENLPLLNGGMSENLLISPRTEKEYGIPHNGAPTMEQVDSLALDSGNLPQSQVLQSLEDGLFISNLWYLNWSDANSARITGMTRFACFLVENGQLKAPITALRFDDSLYQMLGENLEALTREQEVLMDNDSYFRRSRGAKTLPGALLKSMRFTL
ncbi:metallopeptidase TldD-related protein [Endozoicomonas sp. Mp262]|uniref:metallopeptidase TldD-related protein n=1 Tax=Endozoicomonas sp. Mp262 TaxID=2919499 RepID=UPI0021DB2D50